MVRRLRQVTDLYTVGKVKTLADGSPVWVQALNPFEVDTARSEGQIARARLVLAIKEHGSDEQAKVRMYFFEDGIVEARKKVVEAKVADEAAKILDRIQNDPEWTERLTILQRGLDGTASQPESEEFQLLETIANEYSAEVERRFNEERAYQAVTFEEADEETLWDSYLDWHLARRGAEVMLTEYRLHQVLFGARECVATREADDEEWDHSDCQGHDQHLFLSIEEIRSAPEELVQLLIATCNDIDMTAREAKNSDRQGSSADSSPLPSELGESTPSTPQEIPVAPPGSSSLPSTTP